jgi:hypothetical protein
MIRVYTSCYWKKKYSLVRKNRQSQRRTLSVTLLSALVLILSVIHLIRMIIALSDWDFLRSVLSFSPIYLVLTGMFWSVTGFITFYFLWRRSKFASWLTMVFLLSFTIYYWFDRLVMPGFRGRNVDWPFAAVLNGILFTWSMWVVTRPSAKRFFEATNEQRAED